MEKYDSASICLDVNVNANVAIGSLYVSISANANANAIEKTRTLDFSSEIWSKKDMSHVTFTFRMYGILALDLCLYFTGNK